MELSTLVQQNASQTHPRLYVEAHRVHQVRPVQYGFDPANLSSSLPMFEPIGTVKVER